MVGDSGTEVFWSQFLRSLRERGLGGVRLVIADHHSGLVKAVRKVMLGAGYQRCRVHFLRNVFAVIPKDAAEMIAATIRTIFAQPHATGVRSQLDTVADMLGRQFPKVRAMLLEAKTDLTAFADFPERHWKKIQSTNPPDQPSAPTWCLTSQASPLTPSSIWSMKAQTRHTAAANRSPILCRRTL